MPDTSHCLCCGRDLPSRGHFAPNMVTCRTCTTLSVNDAVITTHATVMREQAHAETRNKGRREARKGALLTSYAETGKRCGACHVYKAPTEFDACAPRPDGLQSQCRACNKLRVTLIAQPGGMALWHNVRDSMRAKALDGVSTQV